MEWKTDLQILKALPIKLKGQFIRLIYNIIEEHKGKDFKDLEDLMNQIYPKRDIIIQPVPAGVNIQRTRRSKPYYRKPRRESAFYETEVQDLEQEARE